MELKGEGSGCTKCLGTSRGNTSGIPLPRSDEQPSRGNFSKGLDGKRVPKDYGETSPRPSASKVCGLSSRQTTSVRRGEQYESENHLAKCWCGMTN